MMKGGSGIFKSLLQRDFFAKIGNLVLAVILWALISSNMIGKVKIHVPIEVKNPYENLAVSNMSSRNVIITFEGKKEFIKNISAKSVRAYLGIDNPETGKPRKYPVQLIRDDIQENVTLSLSVRHVTVTLEKKTTRLAKVVPRITGTIMPGYVLGKISVNPEAIILSGARSVMDGINIVNTVEIPVDQESKDIIRDAEIDRENLPEVELSKTAVRIIVPVYKQQDLTGLKINMAVINQAKEYKYALKSAAIKIFVRSAAGAAPDPGNFEAFVDAGTVDLKALFGGNENKSVEITLPVKVRQKNNAAGADVAIVEPETATLKITRK